MELTKPNSFEEYVGWSRTLAFYPYSGNNFTYPALGLIGEIGEFTEDFKFFINNNIKPNLSKEEKYEELKKELGDCLYFFTRLYDELYKDEEKDEYPITWDIHNHTSNTYISNFNTIDDFLNSFLIFSNKMYNDIQKVVRDDNYSPSIERKQKIRENMLRMIGYFNRISDILDETSADIMLLNMKKLENRKERSKVKGDGDNR